MYYQLKKFRPDYGDGNDLLEQFIIDAENEKKAWRGFVIGEIISSDELTVSDDIEISLNGVYLGIITQQQIDAMDNAWRDGYRWDGAERVTFLNFGF